ncbi:MAG TPA: hypothetical protein DCF63_11215 [Planctomycetaceae bacterium]|nr:hypothetical protein [Planctomycetaceae bacterium]
MVGQSGKKKSGKRIFSGSHQRSWLWGYHAVTETIRAARWPIFQIFATREAYNQSLELMQSQSQLGVPIEIVPASRLEQLVPSAEHQGIIARLGEFPYLSLEAWLAKWQDFDGSSTKESGKLNAGLDRLPPLVVICDRIQDAFNLGAILRCCDGAAALGVIVGDKSQAEVTPHVVRSSSGAVNYVPIVRTDDLIQAASLMKQMGSQVVAADSNATCGIWGMQLGSLTTVIVGSEAHGIQPDLLALADHRVCIPMMGRVTSLNAAVATGILLYEIRRQQIHAAN